MIFGMSTWFETDSQIARHGIIDTKACAAGISFLWHNACPSTLLLETCPEFDIEGETTLNKTIRSRAEKSFYHPSINPPKRVVTLNETL